MKRPIRDTNSNSIGMPFISPEIDALLRRLEAETGDVKLVQSVFIKPTALTFIKRLLEAGGTIITDTMLVAGAIDPNCLGQAGAKVACFIDEPQIVALAERRRITRAEVAVDYALAVHGPKLLIIGSAPAAISRILARRKNEPMSDVCVLASCSGFANVIQLKERLMDSEIASIVVRGKKGGIPSTIALTNTILRQIQKPAPVSGPEISGLKGPVSGRINTPPPHEKPTKV